MLGISLLFIIVLLTLPPPVHISVLDILLATPAPVDRSRYCYSVVHVMGSTDLSHKYSHCTVFLTDKEICSLEDLKGAGQRTVINFTPSNSLGYVCPSWSSRLQLIGRFRCGSHTSQVSQCRRSLLTIRVQCFTMKTPVLQRGRPIT